MPAGILALGDEVERLGASVIACAKNLGQILDTSYLTGLMLLIETTMTPKMWVSTVLLWDHLLPIAYGQGRISNGWA